MEHFLIHLMMFLAVLRHGGSLGRGCLLVTQAFCRWEVHGVHVLLDESSVCGIDFSNAFQGHTCF